MEQDKTLFSGIFDMIADFGEAYSGAIIMFFNSVFRRPLLFVFRRVKRFIRYVFRVIVIFFSPADVSGKQYADDVTRAVKRCLKIFFTHPFSLPSVLAYYIRKAATRYDFSVKNIALWVLPLFFVILLGFGINLSADKTLGLEISSDGEVLGYVADETGYINAKNEAREMLRFSDGVSLPSVSYSLAVIDKNRLSDSTALCNALIEKSTGDKSYACGVFIDGSLLCVISSEDEGRAVLKKLLSAYENENNYVVGFSEEIEFRQGLYDARSIITKNEFEEKLLNGEKKTVSYDVKEGDTVSSVAKKYLMTEEELISLNSLDENTAELEAGSVIDVTEASVLLTVKEVRTEVVAEEVDFEKIEIKSNALYNGSSRVLLEGKTGYDQVTNLVTYIGGERVQTTEAYRLSVTKPVSERVQVGTKPLDEAYSNSMGGIFLWPIIGAYGINSDYGYRWGKLHAGIDLGMGNAAGTSLGKTIIAVAQGTVLVAGVHSSYGYYVIIDHGGGLQTLYAHCLAESLMVVPGQVVAAGEPIARVGSTGYSTGPHLHFEVRVNGNRVNPRPYLGI